LSFSPHHRPRIISCGHAAASRLVTNHDLMATVDTTHEWIKERSGIHQRYIAGSHENTATLAAEAAKAALSHGGMGIGDIDGIIVATTTPVNPFPSTAALVQRLLGANKGFAFDIQAVCSGFIYGLSCASSMIIAGQASRLLVIGAEVMSRLLDWNDRSTCVLFGDGAGAIILEAHDASTDELSKDAKERGVLSTHLYSDGNFYDLLYVDDTSAGPNHPGSIRMNGAEVYKHAVSKFVSAINTALEANNLTINDVKWFIPHQANSRIIKTVGQSIGLKDHQLVMNVDRYANTSAASIFIAMSEAWQDGRIQPHDTVLCASLGAGLTWGSALIRF
jgi:3-oxoacyl-[acyl-carrier-protein] synthase-3